MATGADEMAQFNKSPLLAKLFMSVVVLAMLACVAAMLPFLTGRTHGFSAALMLPFVLLFVLCAAVLHWGVKGDAKFLTGAKVLLILQIVFSLTFTNILDPHTATGMNVPVVAGIVISIAYLGYFFRSKRLRSWYRGS